MRRDTVFIDGLQLETLVGIHPMERELRRRIELDIELYTDFSRAAASDHIDDALDYSAVAERLRQLCAASECYLIEALIERCADLLLAEFAIDGLMIRLNKPGAVPQSCAVGVCIERWRRTAELQADQREK